MRCITCRLHVHACVCAEIVRVETTTRVVVVMHHTEARRSTNTGRLALACLPNSELHLRGVPGAPETLALEPRRERLVLFPHEDAEVLTQRPTGAPPVTLVVPDGTFRQASKVRARVEGLESTRAVRLPPGAPSRYRLRAFPHAHALSTIEAIGRALTILEGDPTAEEALTRVFLRMVSRTLEAKGITPG